MEHHVSDPRLHPCHFCFFAFHASALQSYALAIIGAEYIAGMVPVGTHEWDKFVTPRELHARMRTQNLIVRKSTGMLLNPLTGVWRLDDADLDVNYIVCAQRPLPRDD